MAPIGFQDANQRAAALAAFHAGTAQLACPANQACLLNWIQTRPAANRLMQAQRWDDLADVVLAANYDQDLAWFYLGLAASGVGDNEAAKTYLDRSLQRSIIGGSQSCLPNLCDGINLPTDAQTLMASLPPPEQPQRAVVNRPRRVVPRRATPAPVRPASTAAASAPAGGTSWVAPVPSPQ